jgi:RTX calcium-binding nonapeptide repeat (4 copies)
MRMLRWVRLVVGVAAVCAGAGSVLSVSSAVAGNVKTATNSVRVQTARQHAGTGIPVNLCGNTPSGNSSQFGNSCVNVRELAKVLRKRDPGKRVDGETLVATKTGAVLRGARRRINFEMALGRGEVLIGGATHDELGAYTGVRGVRIDGGAGPDLIHGIGLDQHISGGAGNDLIYGGPGDDMINGGPGDDTIYGGPGNDTINGGGGDDRIMDLHGATTVTTGSGAASVDVRDGQGDDRVICGAGGQTRVLADRSDRLSRSCRRMTVSAATRIFGGMATGHRAAVGPVAHTADGVTGNGTDNQSYEQDCTTSYGDYCSTPLFPARTLQHLWSNEGVPSYACQYNPGGYSPGADPVYLYPLNLAPGGTIIPWGLGVLGLGPIGMSITGTISGLGTDGQAAGTDSSAGASSVTNWQIKANSYQIQLYCTNDAGAAWPAPDILP